MMIKNTKIEKKHQFYNEVLFPQLDGNGDGIGQYISTLEMRVRSLTDMLKIQSEEIQRLNQLLNTKK